MSGEPPVPYHVPIIDPDHGEYIPHDEWIAAPGNSGARETVYDATRHSYAPPGGLSPTPIFSQDLLAGQDLLDHEVTVTKTPRS
jgi:hypothetical protein